MIKGVRAQGALRPLSLRCSRSGNYDKGPGQKIGKRRADTAEAVFDAHGEERLMGQSLLLLEHSIVLDSSEDHTRHHIRQAEEQSG
jgi:hypothetical protein